MCDIKRYECSLSPALLEKAALELNEPKDNEKRLQAIDKLRSSFNTEKYGPLVRSDDAFILRFLRAKKFKHEKALKCLQNYHMLHKDLKEVFVKVRNPVSLQSIMDSGVFYVAEGTTDDGVTVIIYRPGLLDPKSDIYNIVAYFILCIEVLLESEEYQICGNSTVEDLKNFNLKLITKLSPSALKKMNSIWQDAMPVRFKTLHVLHEGKVFDVLFALFKPFMKNKIIKRIRMHGTRYNEMFKDINPNLIPPYIGGTGPEPDVANRNWCDKIKDKLCNIYSSEK